MSRAVTISLRTRWPPTTRASFFSVAGSLLWSLPMVRVAVWSWRGLGGKREARFPLLYLFWVLIHRFKIPELCQYRLSDNYYYNPGTRIWVCLIRVLLHPPTDTLLTQFCEWGHCNVQVICTSLRLTFPFHSCKLQPC